MKTKCSVIYDMITVLSLKNIYLILNDPSSFHKVFLKMLLAGKYSLYERELKNLYYIFPSPLRYYISAKTVELKAAVYKDEIIKTFNVTFKKVSLIKGERGRVN